MKLDISVIELQIYVDNFKEDIDKFNKCIGKYFNLK